MQIIKIMQTIYIQTDVEMDKADLDNGLQIIDI